MKVKCPQCGNLIEYENNPHRPFCSVRCKTLDLGDWASEKYAVPSEETADVKHEQQDKKKSEDQD
jgi:endogenous inhibitor of DNA gyrase (YacG/DUF329 family)